MQMAREQDTIGWWQFMEGMMSKSMRTIWYDLISITGKAPV
jgi:hypothetical protein